MHDESGTEKKIVHEVEERNKEDYEREKSAIKQKSHNRYQST
jgi:hypothetical protein